MSAGSMGTALLTAALLVLVVAVVLGVVNQMGVDRVLRAIGEALP